MKGAIEVLRNVRALCSQRDYCVGCPLDNRCPGVKAPDLWSDEMIYTMVGLPRYEEVISNEN